MSNETPDTNQSTEGYSFNPDHAGSDVEIPDYSIAEEDQELAASIRDFDPLDAPSAVTFKGGTFKAPKPTLAALPPELRAPIAQELANAGPMVDKEAREAELVTAALKQAGINQRIKAGLSGKANEYQHEVFQIAREITQYQREALEIDQQLAEVSHWKPDDSSPTGQTAVPAIEGTRREGLEGRRDELLHRVELLEGLEGERRKAKALYGAVEAHKARQQELDEDRDARARAEEIVRNERVEAKAEAFAKSKRNTL